MTDEEDSSPSDMTDEEDGSPLERFFAKYSYSGFEYDPEEPVIDGFNRLCGVLGLDPNDGNSAGVQAVRKKLRKAMVLQFNSIYGTDVESVTSWQCLCRVLGISPVPTTLDECKKVGLRSSSYTLYC